MEYRIEEMKAKKILGFHQTMSLVQNTTHQLWKQFMSNRLLITNAVGSDKYSIQVYDSLEYFKAFDPNKSFTKWAGMEVEDFESIPFDFKSLVIPEGKYAVFTHKGTTGDFAKTMGYIFSVWIPKSDYRLDDRPHFEVLGEKYIKDDPNSEEEVWIPVSNK